MTKHLQLNYKNLIFKNISVATNEEKQFRKIFEAKLAGAPYLLRYAFTKQEKEKGAR